jgi:hypothetical protein
MCVRSHHPDALKDAEGEGRRRKKKRIRATKQEGDEPPSADAWIDVEDWAGLARHLSKLDRETELVRAVDVLVERISDPTLSTRDAIVIVAALLEQLTDPNAPRLLLTSANLWAVVQRADGRPSAALLAKLVAQESLDDTLLLKLVDTLQDEVLLAVSVKHKHLRSVVVEAVLAAKKYPLLMDLIREEAEGEARRALCASVIESTMECVDTAIELKCVDLLRAATPKCPLDLLARIPLPESRAFFVRSVLVALKDKSAKTRLKGIKALQVAQPPVVLAKAPDLLVAVDARFLDQSVQVREATVEFAGQTDPVRYFKQIVDRALDTGLSVRKRVVRILSRMGRHFASQNREDCCLFATSPLTTMLLPRRFSGGACCG